MDNTVSPIVHLTDTQNEHVDEKDVEVTSTPALADDDGYPEGGLQAWSVVGGAFLTLFPSFGFMVSIGTLQQYWHTHQLAAYTIRDVGWIPSVFVYLALGLGGWVGPIYDRYGPTLLLRVGGVFYVGMMFVLAECNLYWQFVVVLGLWGGVCGACLTTTSLGVVSQWFKRRRGLACGMAMIGSSFGGLTIPIILRTALPIYGYAWSIRILGFTFLGCVLSGNFLLKARLEPGWKRGGSKWTVRDILSLDLFGDMRFLFLTIAVFALEVVLFGALGILPAYARTNPAYPDSTAFYVISVMNGVSCLGRLLPSLLADIYGRLNVMIIMTTLTLTMMLALWLPLGTSSLTGFYIFIALFGFGTGTWMGLLPACIGQICRIEEFGR